jgi:CBS domain-containing protein
MRCDELMKRDVKSIGPDEPAQQAAQIMRDTNVGFLPVCVDDNKVIGTLTDRDITVRLVAEGDPSTALVESIMSDMIVNCRPDDDLQTAEELMATNGKSRIIVTDEDGGLLGVISLSDIARTEDSERIASTLRRVASRESSEPLLH